MKIEKKTIALCIFALAIGIATIMPIAYLTGGSMKAAAQIAPCFKTDIPYICINLYNAGGNNTMNWDGAHIQGIMNFTLTPDAINIRGADAQIDFYRLHFYSDKGPIVNMTYSVGVSGKYAITGATGSGTYMFADGTTFDSSVVFGVGTGGHVIDNNLPEVPLENDYVITVLSNYIADYGGEKSVQALTDLRNTQTLYLDVSRIGSVSYHGNSGSTTTITTLDNEEVLCHIEFTKIDGGFVYGNYVEGSVPFSIQTPSSSPTMSPIVTPFEVFYELPKRDAKND